MFGKQLQNDNKTAMELLSAFNIETISQQFNERKS